ncbi:rod shape-determining protein MreC [Syntrophus gentianae]|uniref:Cell shape-determining protein MreC n=1 Tax=Syntrophus gentianae TaxID=43775 RepID=A0A1H7X2A5_9BACT|nr:rod shape-determining protein MreC [Syntrophus gentianae]SEM27990.1 rod shape-determining protein MreC [Syntrophus gentianae]
MPFLKKHRSLISAIILVVISLVMLSYHVVNPAVEPGFLRKLVLDLAVPIERAVNMPVQALGNMWKRYLFLVGLERENRRLLQQNALLTRQLVQHQEGYLEGLRLKKLLSLSESIDYKAVAASVTGRNRKSLHQTVMIDKGSAHGIKTGMPVVSERGVVGRIIETSWHVSRVLLLIDENSNVDSIAQGGRGQGILQGDGNNRCFLKYVPKLEEVRLGDAVITSGICGVFPKSWLLGTVSRVTKGESGLFQTVEVLPSVNFPKLEEVLVLTERKKGRKD